jgi:hypothetical protein
MTTLFTTQDSAVLLVDFQVGTISWVGSTDQDALAKRVIAFATAIKASACRCS